MNKTDPFGARQELELGGDKAIIYSLEALDKQGLCDLDRLPFSIRVLLENALRHVGQGAVTEEHVRMLAGWTPETAGHGEIPYMPARVVLQDFTGVPCVVDLAAMRDAMAEMGGDPARINPVVPCDLVIDHSVQVDFWGSPDAIKLNVAMEFERNSERYQLLKFAQKSFSNFRVVPPGTGIVHQVNLEYLSPCVQLRDHNGELTAFPDTLVGTDSHTTMINGLGVMGWGVGGIEAEAVLLGQPYFMVMPEVIGMKLVGKLPAGCTATDLVLRVTEMLRAHGVVSKFVEFYGPGLSSLPLADRATIGNMSPEYGATMGFFPVDHETLKYLRATGRSSETVARAEAYCEAQRLLRHDDTPDPTYSERLELDLGTVVPSVAGPKRPQDRVPLEGLQRSFAITLPDLMQSSVPESRRTQAVAGLQRWKDEGGAVTATAARSTTNYPVEINGEGHELHDGSIVIAAITSCTNTSNPSVMVGAGLVARKARARGLTSRPWVKTSMAPGSRVVTDYLTKSGLNEDLDALGFETVGYGCTTCIGNSGPLPEPVAAAIEEHHLVTASVLSGNRNFEARIHPMVRANYLMSPLLVVAYSIFGRVDGDITTEPLGIGDNGEPVFLKDVWPTPEEIRDTIAKSLDPEMFERRYAAVFDGDEKWRELPVPTGTLFEWDSDSTYVRLPPFFVGLSPEPEPFKDIEDARVLLLLGDSITTDHISPAGAISKKSPAAQYLRDHGVEQPDWNTYGSRRGNHEVMMRGTFGNVRIRNLLVPGVEGDRTIYFPTGEETSVYDASMRYQEEGVPLVVLTGSEYGSGSSRDWAAKGTILLGVMAVIATSYERIHRSNLIGMGVIPLTFPEGKNAQSLGLTGREVIDITGIASGMKPLGNVHVVATDPDGGKVVKFEAKVQVNSDIEMEYLEHGGILQRVLRVFNE